MSTDPTKPPHEGDTFTPALASGELERQRLQRHVDLLNDDIATLRELGRTWRLSLGTTGKWRCATAPSPTAATTWSGVASGTCSSRPSASRRGEFTRAEAQLMANETIIDRMHDGLCDVAQVGEAMRLLELLQPKGWDVLL